MNRSIVATYTMALGLSCALAGAQTTQAADAAARAGACSSGAPVAGLVHDTTGATVAEAAITLEDGTSRRRARTGASSCAA